MVRQMVLPIAERSNGVTPAPVTAAPATPPPAPVPEPVTAERSVAPATPVAEVPGWVQRITTLSVVLVAVVAAVGSYEHMRTLAESVGEGWRSWLLPFSVDGLAVAASMTMLVRRRAGQKSGALAWAALLLGLGASLAANVIAADPSLVDPVLVRRVVAAWPPIALLFAYELLMQQIKARGGSRPGNHPNPGASNPFGGTRDGTHP